MKKVFSEPVMECVRIENEVIASDVNVPGGELGNTSNNPFEQ